MFKIEYHPPKGTSFKHQPMFPHFSTGHSGYCRTALWYPGIWVYEMKLPYIEFDEYSISVDISWDYCLSHHHCPIWDTFNYWYFRIEVGMLCLINKCSSIELLAFHRYLGSQSRAHFQCLVDSIAVWSDYLSPTTPRMYHWVRNSVALIWRYQPMHAAFPEDTSREQGERECFSTWHS